MNEIDKARYLAVLQKIQQGDLSGFSEIIDVQKHIQELKQEINVRSDTDTTLEQMLETFDPELHSGEFS